MRPTFEEFKAYAFERIKKKRDDPNLYTDWLEDKYDAWEEAGWKKESKGKYVAIVNWKATVIQCIPYRVKNKTTTEPQQEKQKRQNTGKVNELENKTLLQGWNHYSVMRTLRDKIGLGSECFKILASRGIFITGDDMPEKWKTYYTKIYKQATALHLGNLVDANPPTNIPEGEAVKYQAVEGFKTGKKEIQQYAQVLVVEDWFKRIETEDQLKRMI